VNDIAYLPVPGPLDELDAMANQRQCDSTETVHTKGDHVSYCPVPIHESNSLCLLQVARASMLRVHIQLKPSIVHRAPPVIVPSQSVPPKA